MFLAKELPISINKLNSYSKYVNRFVESQDITNIKYRDYKNTNLTILWTVNDATPVMLLNISGALSLIRGLNSEKFPEFKAAIKSQILSQRTVPQSNLHLNKASHGPIDETTMEIRVLKGLVKKLEQHNDLTTNTSRSTTHSQRYYNKNSSQFISISQIASKDYHTNPYWLNKHLEAFNLQYKQNGVGPYRLRQPNQRYAELVYRKGGHTCLKWHPLGRKLIHKVMYQHGYSWHK